MFYALIPIASHVIKHVLLQFGLRTGSKNFTGRLSDIQNENNLDVNQPIMIKSGDNFKQSVTGSSQLTQNPELDCILRF